MKIKFKKIERIAGLFVLAALFGAIAVIALAAVKKGWFQTKVNYTTQVFSADGLRPGSVVTIAGIRAGEIEDVELMSADNIIVHFFVFEKFQKQIRKDSKVQIVRPFIIGDKAIEITVGSEGEEVVAANSRIDSEMAFDMMDLMNGKKLGPFLSSVEGLMTNMSMLMKAFADPKRTEAFIKMFDRMDPLIMNMNIMSLEIINMSRELNTFLPQLTKESPEIGKQMGQLVTQLNNLTGVLTPAFQAVGPELPQATKRALEALDQMVITLKAMQKSFLLSGKVEDVKEEEKRERERSPASER